MQHKLLHAFLTLLPYFLASQVFADSLDKLPPAWQQELQPVIQVDLSPLKPDEQTAIRDKRAEVEALLLSGDTSARALASQYGKLGNLYLTHDLFTSADACYNNAIRLHPGHFPWLYYSGYLAQENGNMETALARYEQAIELDPDYLTAKYRLAQVYLDLNRPDEASALYTSLLASPKLQAAAHNGMGQVMLMRQDYPVAIQHFTKALELAPEANQIHYPLALALRASGKKDQAKQHLQQMGKIEITIDDPLIEQLEELKNPANRHFVAAMSAVLKKNYVDSLGDFRKGLEYAPDNSAARTSYARVLYLTNDRKEARAQLNTVIAKDPDKTLALFLLAVLEDESNNTEQAAKLYKRVLALDPQHQGAHFFIGSYYLKNSDYKDAIRHYEAATAVNEKNIPAQILKLVAMMGDDYPDRELLNVSRQITERAPNALAIKRIQILLLAISDEPGVRNAARAREQAELMVSKQPFPVNLELLAIASASAGDFDSAYEQLRKAIQQEQQYGKSNNILRMKETLSLLEKQQLPLLDWQAEITNMLPPPVNGLTTFRDYPDANPI